MSTPSNKAFLATASTKSKGSAKGKGSPYRMSKILRDNINGITDGSIQRLARRGGVKRLSGLVYAQVRAYITAYLQNVLRSAVTIVDFERKKTVDANSVAASLPTSMFSADISDKKAGSRQTARNPATEKTRRSKAGTEALRDIRHFQKNGELLMAKSPFERVVREVAQNFKTDLRFSEDAILLLQYATEEFLVDLFKNAQRAAVSAGRVSVQVRDLQLVRSFKDAPVGKRFDPPAVNLDTHMNFVPYIKRVLKDFHDGAIGIRSDSASQLNFLTNQLIIKIGTAARELPGAPKTLTSRGIQAAVRMVLEGEIANHAISAGTKAVTKFLSTIDDKGQRKSTSARAGLVFSVSRVRAILKQTCDSRVSRSAPVYLAAVAEYIAAELLELSSNSARDNKHMRITARDLSLVIENDLDLTALKDSLGIQIVGGGVVADIMPALLPKKKASAAE